MTTQSRIVDSNNIVDRVNNMPILSSPRYCKRILMKNLDSLSATILFFLGLWIFLKSLTYPFGSLQSPGAGFFPLLASILLMGLSGSMIVQGFLKKEAGETFKASFLPGREALQRIFFSFLALLGFRYLLPAIGFGPSTFLFIFFLGKILGHYSWKMSLFFALMASLLAYCLFQAWLKIPLPLGILGI